MFSFFMILMTSNLSGLNAIIHSLSQNSSFARSLCTVWQSDWFEMVRYIIFSASSLMLFCILSGMSLIYMRKKKINPVQILGEHLTRLSMGLTVHRQAHRTIWKEWLDPCDHPIVDTHSMEFQSVPSEREVLKVSVSIGALSLWSSFRIREVRFSGPAAFPVLSFESCFLTT